MSTINFPSFNPGFSVICATPAVSNSRNADLEKLSLPQTQELGKLRSTVRSQFKNVYEAIDKGMDFTPRNTDFPSTQAMPGSVEKIEIIKARAEAGLPLWHEDDRIYVSTDLS